VPQASAPLFHTRSDRSLTHVLTGFSKGHNGHLMRHDSGRRRPPIRDISGRGNLTLCVVLYPARTRRLIHPYTRPLLEIHLSHPTHRVIAPSSTRAPSTALDRTADRSHRLPRFTDQFTAAPFPALAVSRARRSLRGLQAPLCRLQHSIAPPFRMRLICVQSSSVALRPHLCA
jgi:hypothetical protein